MLKISNLREYLLIPITGEDTPALITELKRLEWIFIICRCIWIPIIFILAWLHNPLSEYSMIAIGLSLVSINAIACFFNIKIRNLHLQRLLSIIMLAIDILVTWGVIFLFVNDFYTAAYACFVYIIIEGAIRFGLIGSLSMLLVFILGLYTAYVFRDWQFGIRFSTSGFIYWTALMFIVSISLGIIVNEWKRQHRQSKRLLKERTLLSERHRIAQDLHDSVLKTLQGLTFEAHTLKKETTSSSLKKRAQYIEEVCSNTSREIRELIFDLNCEKTTLIGALIEEMLKEWGMKTKITHEFILSGQDIALEAKLTKHISNIISEALSNIRQHSSAHSVSISMEASNDNLLSIEVRDNGCGIKCKIDELHLFVEEGKLGIAGMKERVESLGGKFSLKSDESGTQLYFQIPVSK